MRVSRVLISAPGEMVGTLPVHKSFHRAHMFAHMLRRVRRHIRLRGLRKTCLHMYDPARTCFQTYMVTRYPRGVYIVSYALYMLSWWPPRHTNMPDLCARSLHARLTAALPAVAHKRASVRIGPKGGERERESAHGVVGAWICLMWSLAWRNFLGAGMCEALVC